MPLDNAAGEGLGHGVGGDEAEAAQRVGLPLHRLAPQSGRCLVPEVHDEVGAAGNLRAGLPRRLGVAVAQLRTHVLAADEGRVTHDELGFRPLGRAWIRVAVKFYRCLGIGNLLAGNRVKLRGNAVPACERHAVLVAQQFLLVPGQDRVLFFDRAIGVEDRLGNLVGLDGAQLPLEVADPQHEIGDGDGAGVDLQAVELARADRLALHREARVPTQVFERVQHLAFQPLHQLQRDVEEVAGAAGRVQHAGGAEPMVKILDRLKRRLVLALPLQRMGTGQCLLPIGA